MAYIECPEFKMLLVVAAALIDGNGRVLVQRRPETGSMAGLWEFPGGKLETGETPEAGLCRELAEELGIVVEECALSPLGFASAPLQDRHLVMLLFAASEWQGVPQPLHASAIQWASPAQLLTLPMPPADAPLIPLIAQMLSSRLETAD